MSQSSRDDKNCEEPFSNITQDDVDAYVGSLIAKDTPWAKGCAALIASLWGSLYSAPSSTSATTPTDGEVRAAIASWFGRNYNHQLADEVPEFVERMRGALQAAARVQSAITSAELLEALRPFATLGGPDDGSAAAFHDLEDDVAIYVNSGRGITAGDVRRARKIVSQYIQPIATVNRVQSETTFAWIPVGTSDMPAEGDHVLVYNRLDKCEYTAYTRDGKWRHACGNGSERYVIRNVTHWGPLPDVPLCERDDIHREGKS